MNGTRFAAALLAAGLLAWPAPAQAGDTLRLGMPGGAEAKALTLKATPADLKADTVAVARGGFARGGFRGGFHHAGFHHGRFHHGFHHARFHHAGFHHARFHHRFHHFHHGFHRGFGFAAFRPWYGRYYPWSFYGLGLGYPYYSYAYYSYPYYPYSYPIYSYSYPLSSYSYPPYGYPCSYSGTDGGYLTGTAVLSTGSAAYGPSTYGDLPADGPPMPPAGESTYPDDGGPGESIPLPRGESATPPTPPRSTAPAREHVTSSPAPGGKWVYPAYGESPRRQAPKEGRSILTALIEAAR